jgi:putative protease
MISESIKNISKPELLAPAGNIETFYAVLRAGADAVYLAGNRFGARAYADNFSEEEIIGCLRYAHLLGKKIYLTVNTLIKNEELDDVARFIEPLYKAGLDGVIVQDLGLLSLFGRRFPELDLHASTQLSVTGKDATEYLKKLGVTRVVPARELSLDEVKEIKDTGVEVECFIHGAMCYSYSGQCLFSSVIGGRSGNRGRCAQPCRLPYSTSYKNDCYPLSLKDMMTVGIIDRLIDAGIDSFKIEGRMKKPEYAAGVTSIYRKYIDKYIETGRLDISDEDIKLLQNLYIRSEVSEGYYNKYNGADMVTIGSPSYNGSDDAVLKAIHDRYVNPTGDDGGNKTKVSFIASFIEGSPAFVSVNYGDITCEAYGKEVDTASNRPISDEDIKKALKKLGNTVFSVSDDDISVFTSESPYYSLKEINELRREVIGKLEEEILKDRGYGERAVNETTEVCPAILSGDITNGLTASVTSMDQLRAILDGGFETINRIYVTETMLTCEKEIGEILSEYKDSEIRFYGILPFIRRNSSKYLRDYVISMVKDKSLKGVVVRNLEDLEFFVPLRNSGMDFEIITDFGIYSWNNESICQLSDKADMIGLPLELSQGAHKELLRKNKEICFEKLIYGRYPLMQSANCIFKTGFNCQKRNKTKINFTFLNDRTGRKVPVMADCAHCHNTLYNSVPLSVYNLLNEDNLSYRLDFTVEDRDLTKKVCDYYITLMQGESLDKPEWEYTTGFEKKSTQ